MLANNAELVSTTEATLPKITKHRRKKSEVWEYFTIEVVSGDCKRACCKLCKQTFAYSSGAKISGTSHLKRHIAHGSCPKLKNSENNKRSLASGMKSNRDGSDMPKRRNNKSGFSHIFNQEESNANLAKMIIIHEYPLYMVQHPAFVSFIQSVQPRYKMLDVNAIEAEVLSVYQKEKLNLLQAFGNMPGRVSLTIGLWTTSQNLAYICLTGQCIDSDWKLHRRMLKFIISSSPHSDNTLSEAIDVTLSEWNMKTKLFAITLDNNLLSHDTHSANLRDHLSNENCLLMKDQLFVMQCYVHILNVIAHDAIASMDEIVNKVRESIKFVRTYQANEEQFAEIALQLELPCTKALSLDVATHWDTTYHMIAAALEYKQAFVFLETCGGNYNDAPSADDWKKLEILCQFLKLLFDSANIIMVAVDQTANLFFHEAWKIQLELSNATAHEDPIICSLAKEMHEKFDKYWRDCSLILALAVVMDPRFKMKLFEFSFAKIYGDDCARYIKLVHDKIHELYLEYVDHSLLLTSGYIEQVEGEANHVDDNQSNVPSTPMSTTDAPLDFDIYLCDAVDSQQIKSEIDQYLEESLAPRNQEFDILNWWKLNEFKYPTLSKMARDVLSIPVSMVGIDCSIFESTHGSRVLDEYRSSLHPELVEALFCAKDWFQYLPAISYPLPSAVVKMEF